MDYIAISRLVGLRQWSNFHQEYRWERLLDRSFASRSIPIILFSYQHQPTVLCRGWDRVAPISHQRPHLPETCNGSSGLCWTRNSVLFQRYLARPNTLQIRQTLASTGEGRFLSEHVRNILLDCKTQSAACAD